MTDPKLIDTFRAAQRILARQRPVYDPPDVLSAARIFMQHGERHCSDDAEWLKLKRLAETIIARARYFKRVRRGR